MWDLQACTVCLSTARKLFKIDSGTLKLDYYLVSGLKVQFCVQFRIFLAFFNDSIATRAFMKLNNNAAYFKLKLF